MMSEKQKSGFIEKKHTADFSIYVWASDLETLFLEAAKGMLTLLELEISELISTKETNFELEEFDPESLLVEFLSEVLFLVQNEAFLPDDFSLKITENKLQACLKGRQARFTYKEIKAVTYHNLKISLDSSGYSVTIVFDV